MPGKLGGLNGSRYPSGRKLAASSDDNFRNFRVADNPPKTSFFAFHNAVRARLLLIQELRDPGGLGARFTIITVRGGDSHNLHFDDSRGGCADILVDFR